MARRRFLFDSTTLRTAQIPPKGDGRDELGNFATRVIIRHRILPVEVGGYRVRLAISPDKIGRSDPPVYGAGLFPGLELELQKTTDSFIVSGVKCQDQPSIVRGHLSAGAFSKCAVVAFPELTIDIQIRAEIRLALQKAEHRKPGSTSQLRLVVAGSWHENEGGKTYNISPVFDGFGEHILSHRKIFPYFNISYGAEGISSGGEVSVLVMDDAIIAFGVCRDFCEHGDRNPYLDLDADLFLIVSFGKIDSMEGHLLTASLVRHRYRAHSFVVQQDDSDYSRQAGYVLMPYDDVLQLDAAMTARKGAWVFTGE